MDRFVECPARSSRGRPQVANSLQIIASVLMMSATRATSDETRGHLHEAHHRVMSIAAVQKHLAPQRLGDVTLRSYFEGLCDSIGASMIRDHNLVPLKATADESTVNADISVSLNA
ncbi:histidine kinase dimerization/phosphoacceptor domain -containing protein [uncultured Methylobacterium sp.]|uniref:histidine kinase dimerization/phosphoacceptor domain -containing protein n=1 Tax=uncultured Methylobacterium sp. TaxID=157278 RepID=UPI0035CA5155